MPGRERRWGFAVADIRAQKAGARFAANIQASQAAQTRQAVTGRTYDDGSKSLRGTSGNSDQLTDGRVYITFRDGTIKAAWNMTTAREVDIPVWVDRNPKGQYRVIGVIEDEAYKQFGDGAPSKNSPTTVANDIIYANRIGPGRLKLYSASGAIGSTGLVIVADDFTYLDTNGALKQWTTGSGTLDLSGSVPASGLHTLALIALNPDATTPALTVITLTARAISWVFTAADYGSFSLTPGYVPLATYELVNGDTTFLASRCNYNARLLLSTYRPPTTQKITNTATNYTILVSDETICVTNTGAARTITLPVASACFANNFGKVFYITDKSGGAGTNNITAVASGGDTLLGTAVINTNYGKLRLQAVSSTEFIVL